LILDTRYLIPTTHHSPFTTSTPPSGGRGVAKIPPHSRELEEAVLGAIMIEKHAYTRVSDRLTPATFYFEAHVLIYQAISELAAAGSPIDLLTVTDRIRKNKHVDAVGGAFYITELTDRVASAAHIETHASILNQYSLARQLISECQKTLGRAYDTGNDVFELVEAHQAQVFGITQFSYGRSFGTMPELFDERVKAYEQKPLNGLTGITSGLSNLDALTNGWQRSDLICIAGRPGMGKTAFALNCARNAAVTGKHAVAVFSLEMSKSQLMDRLLCAEASIYQERIRKRELTEHDHQRLHQNTQALIGAHLLIDDTPGISVNAICAKAIRMKESHDIQLIVIDYLQLITTAKDFKGNRDQEIGTISRRLKALAKELDIPVIVLSQLSRAVETRAGGSRRPQLSDLRESGNIEQDTDMVLFVYRPEYYGIEYLEDNVSSVGYAEAIIAKYRNGPPDTALLHFHGGYMRFRNWK